MSTIYIWSGLATSDKYYINILIENNEQGNILPILLPTYVRNRFNSLGQSDAYMRKLATIGYFNGL